MRSSDIVRIHLGGKEVLAEYLGKGRHAKAYRIGNGVLLYVRDCLMKEAIAGINHVHVPTIEYVDTHCEVTVWKMPFYQPLASKYTEAWAQAKELMRVTADANALIQQRNRKIHHTDLGYQMARYVCDTANIPELLRDALEEMIEKAKNYGEGVTFEFSRRNLGVDEQGRLILRDVLYDRRLVWEKMKKIRARDIHLKNTCQRPVMALY